MTGMPVSWPDVDQDTAAVRAAGEEVRGLASGLSGLVDPVKPHRLRSHCRDLRVGRPAPSACPARPTTRSRRAHPFGETTTNRASCAAPVGREAAHQSHAGVKRRSNDGDGAAGVEGRRDRRVPAAGHPAIAAESVEPTVRSPSTWRRSRHGALFRAAVLRTRAGPRDRGNRAGGYLNRPMARATTSTTVISDTTDWPSMAILAHRASGITSVGLNAHALVNETYR